MTRSAKGLGDAAYKIEYWDMSDTEYIYTEGPYATKGAAKARLTSRLNYSYGNTYEGRVLELTGEWVEVE